MFFVLFTALFRTCAAYEIVDEFHLNYTLVPCCQIEQELENFSIIKNEEMTHILVSISPKLESAIHILRELQRNGISAQISNENSTFNIIPSNSVQIDDNALYDIVRKIQYKKYVVSQEECVDASNICPSNQDINFTVAIVLSIIVLLLSLISKIEISAEFCVFDSNLRPKSYFTKHFSKDEKTCQYESLSAVHLTGQPELKVVSVQRSYPCSLFHKVISYPIENGDYICFFWSEVFNEEDEIDLKITFKGIQVDPKRITHQMGNYRKYRPFFIKIDLDTNTIVKLEIPWNVLQPFLPSGCATAMVNSALLQCNKVISSNNIRPSDFIALVNEYSMSLHFKRTIVYDEEGKIVCQFAREGLQQLTKEAAANIYSSLSDENEYISNDLLPDCYATLVRRGDGDVIVIGLDKNQMGVSKTAIPMVALTALFVRQVTLTREKITRYDRFVHLMESSPLFSYTEFNCDTGKAVQVCPRSTDINQDLISDSIDYYTRTKKSDFAIESNGKHYAISCGRVDASSKDGTIGIFTEDITKTVEEKKQIMSNFADIKNVIDALHVFRVDMNTHDMHDSKCSLFEELGYTTPTKLIDIVLEEDKNILMTLGKSIVPETNLTEEELISRDLDKDLQLIICCLKEAGMYERLLVMSKAEREYYKRNPEAMIFDTGKKLCDFSYIRLLDADGRIHFFSFFANSIIGFMYCIDKSISKVYESNTPFPLTTAKVCSTFWGVDLTSNTVFALYGLPTIWDRLGVDPSTPFTNIINFMQGETKDNFSIQLQQIMSKRLQTWTGDVSLAMFGGNVFWFRLSIHVEANKLYCILTQIDDIKFVEESMISYISSLNDLSKATELRFWTFYDVTCDLDFITNDGTNAFLFTWNDVDLIDKEYREIFMKNLRSTIEQGHYFEMYAPIRETRNSEPEWTIMLGKRCEKTRTIHGIRIKTEILRSGLKPTGGRELVELTDMVQKIINTARNKESLTKEEADAINEADIHLRNFRERTTSTSDLSSD